MVWILYLLYVELKYFLSVSHYPIQVSEGGVDADGVQVIGFMGSVLALKRPVQKKT
jgi:hypothetical protein